MQEYEYSFNVENVEAYIEYCQNNGYKCEGKSKQNRMVFEHNSLKGNIARITITETENCKLVEFDSKFVGFNQDSLKISKESLPLIIDENQIETVKSILDVMGYKMSANNFRTRYVYKKDNIKFEIDDYLPPQKSVIGIEGKKEEVDKEYQLIKNKIL